MVFDHDAGDTHAGTLPHRYDDLTLSCGDVVIFDTKNPHAWVQSDRAIDFAAIASE